MEDNEFGGGDVVGYDLDPWFVGGGGSDVQDGCGVGDAGCEGDAEGWVADDSADFVVGYAVLFGAGDDVNPHSQSV